MVTSICYLTRTFNLDVTQFFYLWLLIRIDILEEVGLRSKFVKDRQKLLCLQETHSIYNFFLVIKVTLKLPHTVLLVVVLFTVFSNSRYFIG